MARLMFWVLFLVALFSGYWFLAAQATQTGLQNALAQAQRDGWQVDTTDMGVTGFPGMFSLQVAEPAVISPDGQWAWSGPDVQLDASSIQPNRLSLTLPETQTIRFESQTIQIDATTLEVNAATRLNTSASFDAASVVMRDADIGSDLGWQLQVGSGDVTMTAVDDSAVLYDLDVAIADLAIPDDLAGPLAPSGALGYSLASLTADAQLIFDRPIDRFALEGTSPALVRIDLAGLALNWADIGMNATGALDIDGQGVPTGLVTLKSAQWQAMVDILVATGALDADTARTLSRVAATMAGGDGVLELPITFRDGFMSMGFLPLGPAPVFR